ncbi:MAG: L-seryl-tRNA(Sec) selenium transferase [Actinobacteria bacterium]|nr:L-seryl-tRNA(Sec) selenium transferase [Actinomycetota bacterium]
MSPPDKDRKQLLKRIPQVNELAEFVINSNRSNEAPRQVVMEAARRVVSRIRDSILLKDSTGIGLDELKPAVIADLVTEEIDLIVKANIVRVINATGVVLHTNIGRAPLSSSALNAVREISEGYCNLEYRLDDGERGSRQEHLESIICKLTGSESAIVVNNNAAAVLLVLSALSRGRRVIVSRGQLVEIGDSFRLPDIMQQAGAILAEVGTTNRTRITDYSNAIDDETALIMKIHQSNFRLVGYSEEVPLEHLVELGKQHFLPVVEDLGSGALVDLGIIGFSGEHTAKESIEAGADIVTFSGDKLLGGPQAGIIAGSKEFIGAIRKHPVARAVRIDKMAVAALEATLKEYLDPETAWNNIPTLRMLSEPEKSVRKRAEKALEEIKKSAPSNLECEVVRELSTAGGGSLPTSLIPSYCIRMKHPSLSTAELERRFRHSKPAVLSRIRDDCLLLDFRTVAEAEIPVLTGLAAEITSA